VIGSGHLAPIFFAAVMARRPNLHGSVHLLPFPAPRTDPLQHEP